MLSMIRKKGQIIRIGDDIKIIVYRVDEQDGYVTLAFEAPKEVIILRTEVLKRKRRMESK